MIRAGIETAGFNTYRKTVGERKWSIGV